MGKTAARIALGVVALVLLAGCDPTAMPNHRDTADLQLQVGTTGSATVQLYLAWGLQSELRTTAEGVAAAMFPGQATHLNIDGNDGGADTAEITVPHAYEPGPRPNVTFSIDEGVWNALNHVGVERVNATLCVPSVPSKFRSNVKAQDVDRRCASWAVTRAKAPLVASVTMHPNPGSWYRSLAFALVALVSAIAAAVLLRRMRPVDTRKRVRVAVASAPGAVAFVVAIATHATWPTGHSMGVAGRLQGFGLMLANWVPISLLVTGTFCVVALVMAYALHRRPPPPDGWFLDPTGRHQMRYRLEGSWSEHVGDAGVLSADPIA